jgi:protein CLEC16A
MYEVLQSNAVVREENGSVVVECLRAVAETVIWGDQNDAAVFEYFLEMI